MKKTFFIVLLSLLLNSCVSTKSTLKNVDNNAVKPQIVNNAFVITEKANDFKYGYNKDYPINLGFDNEYTSAKNIALFFNAIVGENNQPVLYKKVDDCCPFPTSRSTMGAGMLVVYEVYTEGSNDKKTIYFNIFDKGIIVCPKGFYIKK
jgi:hypothetical protein